jgi:hypothetical protein
MAKIIAIHWCLPFRVNTSEKELHHGSFHCTLYDG